MNNSKSYKILYYLCFILNIFIHFILIRNSVLFEGYLSSIILGFINLILVLLFSYLLIKKKEINNTNILFPILFLVFSIIVIIIMFLFNSRLMIPYIHYNYYISFIGINYILLNVYSLLSFSSNSSKKI